MAKPGKSRASAPNGRLSRPLEPLVDGEYMDMLREYKRDERKKRKLEPPSHPPDIIKAEQYDNGQQPPKNVSSATPESDPGPMGGNALPPPSFGMEVASESDEYSDDSDEFEDVALNDDETHSGLSDDAGQDVTVSLDATQARHVTRRRREAGLPKATRIAIHKTALIIWMVHTKIRSIWLSSREVRSNPVLRHVFTQRVMRELYPPDHLTDFLKSKRFISGIKSAMEEWRLKFRVVRSGLASVADEKGDPGSRNEFINDLSSLHGSVDMLGQGFFAVMRALGLRARLVCSLQPPDNLGSAAEPSHKTTKSDSPIFWTEIWDKWAPGWISADPLTNTLRMPLGSKPGTAIEPKQSDHLNIMRYCVAWEAGHARDVTRRYASNFNSRTRKKRLPHFESEEWLDRLLAYFGPKKYTRADLVEIRELANYSRKEGIPKRIQDFIGHPQYALSDQLHRNELLKPGAVPCGTLANKGKQVIYIYQRKDVLTAQSAQTWYRKGRSIKPGAQAVLRRETRNRLTGEPESVGLYTRDQTELYIPQPVDENGEVPKSQYRTIDIFTPNMIPEGAVYIKNTLGVDAAKILRIDYANAVTTIEFGKRGPQSKMFGVVIAKENEAAMQLVLQGLKEQQHEDALRKENTRILALWRQYIVGIQIWERVEHMNPQVDRGLESEDATGAEDTDSDSSDSSRDDNEHETITSPEGASDMVRRDVASASIGSDRISGQQNNDSPRRKSVIHIDEYGGELLKEKPSTNTHPEPVNIHRSWIDKEDFSSPDTHSSFSDLDVDEISESELNG